MGAPRGGSGARRGGRAGRALGSACAAAAACALLARGGGGAAAWAPSAAAWRGAAGRSGRQGGLRGRALGGAPRGARRGVAQSALQLIGSQGSRSPLVNWYLHEIGQAFEMVDAGSVDRSSPGFPNPFGQIPALQDGDVKIFESGAILIYLAHKYGGLDSPELLAAVTKWIVWSNASLDPVVFIENEQGQVLDTGLRGSPKQINRLEQLLEGKKWILGDEFSVADVAIASYLLYGVMFFPDVNIGKWPNIARYMAAAAQRPAYARAFGERTAQMLAVKCQEAPKDDKLFGIF